MDEIERKIATLHIETRAFINGNYQEPIEGNKIPKISPIDGRTLPPLSACNHQDIHQAVMAALRSYQKGIWRDTEPTHKQEVLLRLADLMQAHLEELALLDTLETGRSLKNYYYDSIPKAIEAIRWFAMAIDKRYDHAMPPRKETFAVMVREPLGVVGIITPWNDPLVVDFWKITPALLMGNSVVVKPAEQASYSLLRVARLAQEAGIPDGVLNIVPGFGEEAGKALAMHQDVRGIFFTGSSEVGKKILQYAGASNMKKVGLECGGKSPFVVTQQTKQIEKAAQTLAKNIFYNQGQICSAPSRLIIDRAIKDSFLERLVKESLQYRPKDPFDLSSEVGAMVSHAQAQRVQAYIDAGLQNGAVIINDITQSPPYRDGAYINPVIFDHVDPSSKIAEEEIFGPVLVVLGYETTEEAVALANRTKYGLAASIWTDDINEAYRIARALEAGIVHINSYGEDDNMIPFGGIKESGIGKDKSLFAFEEYSYQKSIWMRLQNG